MEKQHSSSSEEAHMAKIGSTKHDVVSIETRLERLEQLCVNSGSPEKGRCGKVEGKDAPQPEKVMSREGAINSNSFHKPGGSVGVALIVESNSSL
jgi:hypothetical protein